MSAIERHRDKQHEADAALGRAIREAIDRSPRMIDLAFTAEKLREVGLPQSAEVIDVIATELRKERGR